jgi:hypothetical protein
MTTTVTAMADGNGDGNVVDGRQRQWRTATAMVQMDDDIVVGNGDGATDDGNGDGNGDGDGVDAMDDGGQRRQRRLVVITTINLPFDRKVVMYWQSSAPPSMRAQQGSLIEMLPPTALKMSAEGKSVCLSLVLLTNASRMEELQNLWNDARVVTAGIWRVPPSNRGVLLP